MQGDGWRNAPTTTIHQGYLNLDKHRTVQVRIESELACLAVEGINVGPIRAEFEYTISIEEPRDSLEFCGSPPFKMRFHILADCGGRIPESAVTVLIDERCGRVKWLGGAKPVDFSDCGCTCKPGASSLTTGAERVLAIAFTKSFRRGY